MHLPMLPTRRRLRVFTMLIAAGPCLPSMLTAQTKRPMTPDDIMRVRAVGSVAMAPAGDRILYTISAWEHPNANPARGDTALGDKHDRRSHVWIVPFGGGTARQLTFGERGESNPQWSPDGTTIAFISARGAAGGDDGPRPQIWLLPADGGEASQLTSARDGVSAYSWSPDGTRIAYLTTDSLSRDAEAKLRRRDDPKVYEGDLRLSHLWVVDLASKQATKITSGDYTARGAPSWSPDGTRLAFDASPTTLIRDERRDAYVVTIATKQLDAVTTTHDVESTPQFSPDGRSLAFTTNGHEWDAYKDGIMPRTIRNARLVTFDLATRVRTSHAQPVFDVSVGQPRWSADGAHLWFSASDRVWQSVYDYDIAAKRYRKMTSDVVVGGASPSKDGSKMAFILDTPEWPAEVYVQDASIPTPKRITNSNPWLADIALGESEVITWKSKDGSMVEGVLLKPVGYIAGTKVPLLVSAHGGPTSAHVNGFKGGAGPGQTWAARGWAVLYPNPRGSTGYGEKWMRGNIPDWGGGDYRDIMTGVDELIKRGVADSARMAFEGWSYGGYMTSWVVSQTGRFKAAMMGAGLPSLLSMASTTDIPGYIDTFFNGMPQYDGSLVNPSIKFYLERSAISYSDKVTTPLLILHGGNDERVPIGQPMEFYRALKNRGKTAELVFYPREGHGLSEYYHQMDRMRREYEWIARYTLGTKTVQ
ncbi:MAG: S9 family peptidase [Gemmatimonadaceae bacterium]|nr:S9 family peptidase [Gemmatimonadaceae bacterium]